jgi:hypothetical protein
MCTGERAGLPETVIAFYSGWQAILEGLLAPTVRRVYEERAYPVDYPAHRIGSDGSYDQWMCD